VNTASNTVSLPNTYTVTVTNPVNGCTASDAVVVTQNITAPNVNAGVDTSLNCVRTSVGLLATSSTTGAIFAWSNAVNTANNSVSSPNTYTVTATNPANGCTASDAVVVTQNITLPNANAGVDTSLNCVRTSVGLLATSSTTGATFAWSNALSTATNTVSSPNTYTVTVTNPANGCTASDAVVVTQNITPSNVNAGVDQVLSCASSSATLSGSSTVSGASYLWSGTGIVSGGNTAIAIVNIAGNYSLMVTDPSNGCTAIDIVNVSPNVNTPNINAGLDQQLTCAITSVTLIATSSTTGATFAWSNAINTASNTVNFPNTYTVTVTDPNNGCMAVDQVLVTQNTTTPNINAGLDTVLTCSRTSLNLLATSSTTGVTYTWSNGPTNANNLVNTANTYTVTALDPSNGCTASDGVVVSQDVTLPNINAGQDTALTCSITNISLQANSTTSPVSYLWSNSTIGSTNTVSMAGTYTVTATNLQNGCSASDAVIVALNITTPNVDAGANQTLSCTKTNATLTGSSTTTAVVYLWSGPGIVSGANTVSATVNQTGTYTLQVTDPSNGCTASDFVNVNPNVNAPNVNAGPDQTLTCAITSTALSATSTTPGVTFLWSNAATTPTTSVNSIGTYSVTVTDPNNGCQATDQVTVNQDISAPIVNAGIDATLTCVISSVQLQASSPVAGVTFVWSNGATSASTTVSAADAYSVTATNPSNGCSASDTVLVDANGVPSLAISSGDNPCPDVAKGFIQTNVTGGVSPYNYSWSNGSNTSSLSQLHGGIYTVTITDANGCSVSQTVSLVEGDSLTILNLDNIILNLGETIQLNPLVTGSTAPLSYTWNPPLYLSCSNCSNPIVNTVGNITYTLYVIDTNGCSSEGMISIHVTPDYQIYVPNAFTPNSDGTNDVFEIYGNKKLWKELNVRIFNRWGEKVFESSDSKFAWDGTFHGVLQNPQVYVYELRITFINGYAMPLQKGSITLIR
jgi:gliding motility-associated-like protein